MAEDGKLSQAEIDALLNGPVSALSSEEEIQMSDYDRDALGEIGNISFGSAATVLSTLLQQRVEITTPTVTLMSASSVHNEFQRPYVMVSVEYTAGLEGSNALAIELQDAKTIADLMLGGDGTNTAGDLNELHLSAVAEAMNQMMGGAATALSSMFRRHINISPPKVDTVNLGMAGDHDIGLSGWIVNISFRLRVGNLIDSSIMQLTPYHFAQDLVRAFVEQFSETEGEAQSTAATAPVTNSPRAELTPAAPVEPVIHSPEPRPIFQDPQPTAAPQTVATVPPTRMTVVQQPEYTDFSADPVGALAPRNLSLLFDVSLNVTVELGRTRRAIREILDLAPGAIVELDKLAGEPVDILVNNKRIAVGEVVVIDENFGVRVTDILAPAERLRNLQQ